MGLLEELLSGGIGRLIFDLLPHEETGKGLRPQSDEALRQLVTALRGGGSGRKAVKAALKAPGTIAVNFGDPTLANPLRMLDNFLTRRRGFALAGSTNPTSRGSEVFLNPNNAKLLNVDIPQNILPHELFHALRFNKDLDTGNPNIEESLARMAAGQPLNTFLLRQFDRPSLTGGKMTPPIEPKDIERLKEILLKTLGE